MKKIFLPLIILLSFYSPKAQNCNNWLQINQAFDDVSVGDLDITGNQMTIEGSFNATGDITRTIVSKHIDPNDVNYHLLPDLAQITTTNGFFFVLAPCDFVKGKTYHVAMVYDGNSLTLYRNGYIMASTPASGDLITNNWPTSIGENAYAALNHTIANSHPLEGFINEVKIWNVARTQAQIRAYMNTPLPNPTTQSGLLAYYTFDNLLNKQGNAAFDGVLKGTATINNTNTSCAFVADSCSIVLDNKDSTIINTYTPVISLDQCNNKLTVEDASTFNVGDTVLMIQMKGALIDSTNTAAFGSITNYNNAGNYEFNYIKAKSGNEIELKNILTRGYDVPLGKVQLIRVPYYKSLKTNSTLTCLPWDGKKGGVLVVNVKDTLELAADINTTGRGFLKGVMHNSNINTYTCGIADYYFPDNTVDAAGKGEGITTLSTARNSGKGPAANGGGGGMNANSGGGGGSNGNMGGRGGYEYNNCPNRLTSQNWGFPGNSLTYSAPINKIFMGGAGGAGHCNNQFDNPAVSADFNGGNGGGLILLNANYLKNNNNKIISSGDSAYELNLPNSYVSHDGMGGGGAGGTVLLNINNYIDNLSIDVTGGRGGNMLSMPTGGLVGPGGGGGGGVVWVKQNTIPAALNITNSGGTGGVIVQNNNDPYGATGGLPGINAFSFTIPADGALFHKNIDSVRIKNSATSCKTADFKGQGFTTTSPITQWQWSFGDNTVANAQNVSHNYSTPGNFTVKLIVSDINGCKDSASTTVTISNCDSTIINTYTPILSLDPCNNKIIVEDAFTFNTGDTVLMIQMKGALIDSSNAASFGNITNYKNTGNYEFNYVKSKSGNTIELSNNLTRQYDIPTGKVQLIRVPYYNNLNLTSTLTCLPWDGNKGGVLVLNVANNITLNANIDVSGKGFKGGNGIHAVPSVLNCNENQFYYPPNADLAAGKGEGIASLLPDKTNGKGKYANGGGGGDSHNSGGGGGSNAASGGFGGYQFEGAPCNGIVPFDNRGIGGTGLTYNNATNKVFLGGGGGAGHANNPELFYPNGGNGGGICIVLAKSLNGNNKSIIANGDSGLACTGYGASGCHEGMGGGGGGGAILLNIISYTSTANAVTKGGNGADMVQSGNLKVGPGGGGGGGVCWLNSLSVPANLSIDASAGINGVCPGYSNDPWGTTAGAKGLNVFSLAIPIDKIPFKTNIDSVRIRDSLTSCTVYDFKGLAYINTKPIATWSWNFGDGATANTQNTNHSFATIGNHTVKLFVTDIDGCKDSTVKTITTNGVTGFDFAYKQDICNPLSIQFFNIGPTPLNPTWLFGDGASVSGNANPTHLYASAGTYTVKYSIQNAACIDTVTKVILLGIVKDDIILTRDTTICFNSTKQLISKAALSFCWSPTTYLDNPSAQNPITSSPQSITYFLTSEIPGNNIITNGDFSGGNNGFTSEYNFASVNTTEGEYFVGPNPQAWNASLSTCQDHTSGNNNMMLVNGAPVGEVNVWKQTVTVQPNTNYAFSTWIQALYPPNPAQLSFSINGGSLGNLITASLPTCNWTQFYTTWNSGSNTSATISIVNKNTFVQGNDFALDDISFSPVLIKRDSVRISIDTPSVRTIADTITCGGRPVPLDATGAASYTWSPTGGLSSAGIANPVATPAGTTQYVVTGTNASGCKASDTVNIAINPAPLITKSNDSTTCLNQSIRLFAGGGVSYSWSPAGTLDNAAIANPIASPSGNTTYTVTVTGSNTCTKTDSVKISVRSLPVFTVSPDQSTCVSGVNLAASGGSSYLWSPAAMVNNPRVSNPVSNATSTTTFTVQIKDDVCHDSTTLRTTVTVLPGLTLTATKSNDIDCVSSSVQLTASGANQYIWSPATGLNDANIANPVATIITEQQYFVTGIDSVSKCTGKTSVLVSVKAPVEPVFYVPTAFSPNGDGRNDCFSVKHFGTVKSVDLSIYNRWGALVFHSLNVDDCWDGRYKGVEQNPGNYVYFIKTFNACGEQTKKGNLILIR